MTTYKKAGVDIHLGDVCSTIMSSAADKTFANRKGSSAAIRILEKRGLHRIITISIGGLNLLLNSDGIGTKAEFAERAGRHDTMAYDLFAMLCDDAVRYGAEPVALSNVLDVNTLDKGIVQGLAKGMVKAAKDAGVAVVSGEIAELGTRVGGYGQHNYNWGGTVLSVVRNGLGGQGMKAGNSIVGMQEKGFRSNGISLVRKIMEEAYGPNWHRQKMGVRTLGDLAITPSKIYTRAALEMFEDAEGIAHITGGGIPGKLGRLLAIKRLGAEITDPFPPSDMMLLCQKLGQVHDAEAYKVWNMGQGMLIITSRPEKILSIAAKYNIRANVVGMITAGPGLNIISRGYYSPGKLLSF
jgi:phosphoribosylformylglycinamidine cyclo-ligase